MFLSREPPLYLFEPLACRHTMLTPAAGVPSYDCALQPLVALTVAVGLIPSKSTYLGHFSVQ